MSEQMTQDGLRARYRRLSNFNIENRRRWVEWVASQVPAGSRVLDVGAGRGQYRELFSHCIYETQDFAQEPSTLGLYTPLDFVSDITTIPVPDGRFDAILCTEVLEHVPEPIKAVIEMGRIVRPGGRLYLTAPLGSWLHQQPYHYYGGYTPYWYERFLTESGFRVEVIARNMGFFSAFAQEALRFLELVDPRRSGNIGLRSRAILFAAWCCAAVVARAASLIAPALDAMKLENIATVGYHVVAVKI